ncbi:MAG: dTDP-4-dehydrorhamnose 3,5-epimerase [Rhodospirillaceae bacterium]
MNFVIEHLEISDVKLIKAVKHEDHRGFFSETYSTKALADIGIDATFVQDNHSFSVEKATLRGLHFQVPPYAQHKLVRVTHGAIFEVAVDIRRGSPTFGKHVSTIVSASSWNQLFIPIGFAHGLMTLEPNTEVLYKVSNYYSRECDKGLAWDDADLDIDWPALEADAIISDKDKTHPTLSKLPNYFPIEDPRL